MRKRTESQLVTACLKFLQVQENLGNILWVDRLNSGTYKIQNRLIRGCRAGTPDLFYLRTDGVVVWVECKSERGKLRESQHKFKVMASMLENHRFLIIRSLDDLSQEFKPFE